MEQLLLFCFLHLIHVVRSAEICCYDTDVVPPENGCYNDEYPFNNMPLPDCPGDMEISMVLYTRDNKDAGQVITKTTIPPVFKSSQRTHFILHGWMGSKNNRWMEDMKNLALDRGDYNMVIVGWAGSSQQLWYPQSASDTRVVGTEVSLVAKNLVDWGGADWSQMYCTGHSLGGHACGHAGQRADQPWGRITGMDPAGPWFEDKLDSNDVGLDATDAILVDVMHTNGEPGIVINLGTMKRLGHMDFYPNGGGTQPGCIFDPLEVTHPVDMDDPEQLVDLTPGCSHMRVLDLYKESIAPNCFDTFHICDDQYNLPGSCTENGSPVASMGFDADAYTAHGIFFLETNKNDPYCPTN